MKNYRDAVKDHCHITGKYRGAAHNDCNLKLPNTRCFHNLRGYDAHHLFQVMSKIGGEIRCIPKNMEKYISLSLGGTAFYRQFELFAGTFGFTGEKHTT